MTGKTHAVAGIVTSLVIMTRNKTHIDYDTYELVSGVLIGALLLDIDNKTSFISNAFPPIAWVVSKLTKHRGIVHILLPFLLIGAYLSTHEQILLWIGLGGISHILIDMIGYIFGITCDSKGEKTIHVLLWIGVCWYIASILWVKYNLHMPKYVLVQFKELHKYISTVI